MKKIKKLLMLIPACGLFLSGCSFEDIKSSVTGLFSGKKEEEKSEQPADSKPADSTPTGGDTTPASTVSFEDMELRIKPIAAALLGKSESELVSMDYDEYYASETATANYLTYNKEDLMFVDLPYRSANESATYSDLFEELAAKLPSSAKLVESMSSSSEEDMYIDKVYEVDGYYYCLFGSDYYGDGDYVYGSYDIVPKTQYQAYHDKVYQSGGGETSTETYASFPLEVVNSFFEENEYEIELSSSEASAISEFATSFTVQTGEQSGYPYMMVYFAGSKVAEVEAIIKGTLEAAGYSKDSESTESHVSYVDSFNYSVQIYVESGYTAILIY